MITGLGQIDTFISLGLVPRGQKMVLPTPLSNRQLTPINFGSHLINVLDVKWLNYNLQQFVMCEVTVAIKSKVTDTLSNDVRTLDNPGLSC